VTIANNYSGKFGGGASIKGSSLTISNCYLIDNAIPAIADETQYWNSHGAGLFTGTDVSRNLPVTGSVSDCLISGNSGIALYEDDRSDPGSAHNQVIYNNNQMFSTYLNNYVFAHIPGADGANFRVADVSTLNTLVIAHSGIDKGEGNTELTEAASVSWGHILAAPPAILHTGSLNELFPSESYIGYAWIGDSATLNGSPVTGNAGLTSTEASGTYTLNSGGNSWSATVSDAATPKANFTVTPNRSLNLEWAVTQGTFLEAAIDRGVGVVSSSGSLITTPPNNEIIYHFYAIMEEGGTATGPAEDPLLSAPSEYFMMVEVNSTGNKGYISIKNNGGSILTWTASTSTPGLIFVDTPSGSTETNDSIEFTVDISGLDIGTYTGRIDIDASAAGSQSVEITVFVVETVYRLSLPVTLR
jgi:hypothetical protein